MISANQDLKGYVEGRRRWEPQADARVMVSGRHGKPTVTVGPRDADSQSLRPMRAAQPLTGPDRRAAALLLIFCLPACPLG